MRHLFTLILALVVAGSFAVTGTVQAEDAEAEFTYVGVKSCKMCHKSASKGDQFGQWEKSAHAKAFETLASEAGMEEAKKHGIENPQEAPECLKCHVTAFPVMDQIADLKITMEEGVSCESCHGPGSEYKSKKVKTAVAAGEITRESVGLWTITEATCTTCHTPEGNSFYKEFVFEERVKEIAHPIPDSE